MDTPPIEIVRLGAGDAARVAELFDAYRSFYEQAPDLDGALAFLADRLARDESVVLLASTPAPDARPAGFVQLYPAFSSVRMTRTWILNDLFVAPEFRRRGVARRLMESAIAHARETGAAAVELETAVDNHAAKPLYETLGFVRDDAFDRYALRI
jgi:ribosomal protein S18 acetylase RimI-like enzyme